MREGQNKPWAVFSSIRNINESRDSIDTCEGSGSSKMCNSCNSCDSSDSVKKLIYYFKKYSLIKFGKAAGLSSTGATPSFLKAHTQIVFFDAKGLYGTKKQIQISVVYIY